MGAFPEDQNYATQLISMSTVIASMVGADKIITKTKQEASVITSYSIHYTKLYEACPMELGQWHWHGSDYRAV